ncbi:PREDICTED: uncharacterized protein LOC107336522 [Acropora digitifera]|uniref:uncharacterized protein LOC107336522 n=1 Tax=Acropora digitifera TaxID=70779 RepID=UPI00077A1CFC|nr:PREDICTED: uncharacterized protein LOC107336522 [Acropora digitifera]
MVCKPNCDVLNNSEQSKCKMAVHVRHFIRSLSTDMSSPNKLAQELVQALRRTLENDSITGDEFVLSQKLKKICLQHHVPFNNFLLDIIITRLDRYSTDKISAKNE